jgi:hypothetical protein
MICSKGKNKMIKKYLNMNTYVKGVAKIKGCFEFYNFGLSFIKENEIYPFLLSRIMDIE